MAVMLVAVDASERAAGVLEAGVALARTSGHKVVLLRVVAPLVDVPAEGMAAQAYALLEQLLTFAKQDVDRLGSGLPAGMLKSTTVLTGSPWRVICDVAQAERAEMEIIGSHGYSVLERMLGTTASRVVNHAPCNVLVVRPPPQAKG